MDPLHEMKVGLWNLSQVVLIGRCERTSVGWRVYRALADDAVFVEVGSADVIAEPRDLDYTPSGYEQGVQGLTVRTGASASAEIRGQRWSGRLKVTKGQTTASLCQPESGGTACVSNLLFEFKGTATKPGKPKLIGFCFGVWNIETPGQGAKKK